MNHYALSKNEETGKQTYVRTAAWDEGEHIELNNVDMSSEIAEELRNMVMLFFIRTLLSNCSNWSCMCFVRALNLCIIFP